MPDSRIKWNESDPYYQENNPRQRKVGYQPKAPIYKSPIEQSKAWQMPPYNKDALVSYLKQYGSGFTDDEYEEWAKAKGRELKKTPLNKDFIGTDYHKQYYGEGHDYTYAPQYLEDEEWLQEVWPTFSEDAQDYYETKGGK